MNTPGQYMEYIKSESTCWAKMVKEAGATLD
jgi:hypothetical protein